MQGQPLRREPRPPQRVAVPRACGPAAALSQLAGGALAVVEGSRHELGLRLRSNSRSGSVAACWIADVERSNPTILHVREQPRIRPAGAELGRAPDEPPAGRPDVRHRGMKCGAWIEISQATLAIADAQCAIRLPARPPGSSPREEAVRRPAWIESAEVVENDLEAVALPTNRADLAVPLATARLSECIYGARTPPRTSRCFARTCG
jgi:hypothetical protein